MRVLPILLHSCLALTLLSSPLRAQDPVSPDTAAPVPLLDTVVVTGTVPGPGMWRVDHGDNTLWILGTTSPVPTGIAWDARDVLATLADAEAVLASPRFSLTVEGNLFNKAALAVSALGARKNPDGRTLAQILDPAAHSRWERLRQQYLPRERGLEKKRPLIAAVDLYQAALRKHGLSSDNMVAATLSDAIKARDFTPIRPRHTVTLTAAQARALLKDTRSADLHDQACLIATMDLIEHGIPQLITNANAWAIGDIARLDTTASSARQTQCLDAFGHSAVLAQHGIPDIRRTLNALWLEQAEKALHSQRSTLAVIAIDTLTGPDGYLQALAQRGYTVQSP